MTEEKKGQNVGDKLSMTLSVFIALCVVSIFCAVSIAIVENIDTIARDQKTKRLTLPHTKEYVDLLI